MARKKQILDPDQPQTLVLNAEAVKRLEAEGLVQNKWVPNRQQHKALIKTEYEIFMAGSRYGGKSEMARIWMVRGNPDVEGKDFDENGNPTVHQSYVYHPMFLGIVVRKNEKDLHEWVDKAKPYYEALGGEYIQSPAHFRFPSGAKIHLGHAEDSRSWEKYQGLNVTRFLIEEAGQIPNLETYELIRASCRSVYPELRAQMLLTANPIGPGLPWLYDRFIEPRDRDGELLVNPNTNLPYLAEETVEEKVIHPFTGETEILTRVWIPSYMTDNPHAMKDKQYILSLASITDEKTMRAFVYGDWKAFKGTYFDFKPDIHTKVWSEMGVEPWWKRTASLDIGYSHNSAFYVGAHDPFTGRLIVEDELVVNETEFVELGSEIAYRLRPILETSGSITMYISHDAYHRKTGDVVVADLLEAGIRKILGKGNVFVPETTIRRMREQYENQGKIWTPQLEEEIHSRLVKSHSPKNGILMVCAPKSRVAGWNTIRSYLRYKPIWGSTQDNGKYHGKKPDPQIAMQIAHEGNVAAYLQYLAMFAPPPSENLPKMLIASDRAPKLVKAIPKAIHDDKNPEDISRKHFDGADSLDSWRYLVTGSQLESQIPFSRLPTNIQRNRYVQTEVQKLGEEVDFNTKLWLNREFEAQQRLIRERKSQPIVPRIGII